MFNITEKEYIGKLKTFGECCKLSQNIDIQTSKVYGLSYRLWHYDKYLTVEGQNIKYFDNKYLIYERFSDKNTIKIYYVICDKITEVSLIQKVQGPTRMMTAYDYWFDWIIDPNETILSEELFEI